MRKTAYLILCAALGLVGCAKTERIETSPSPSPSPSNPDELIPLTAVPAPTGNPVTIFAGFADEAQTRSRLEPESTAANVLWTAGDSFRCLFNINLSTGRYSMTTFSTQDDGVSRAGFTTYANLTGNGFYCFYPDKSNIWLYQGELYFGINLPDTQNAKAGGIEEGLNRAFAYADQLAGSAESPLVFYNVISLIKFRMDGSVASQVKEIKFSSSGALAGDFLFKSVNGIPTECPGLSFNGSTTSSQITLKGDFEVGTDYYIAVLPGRFSRFQMEFSDGAGKNTVKQSSKELVMERSRVKDFGTIHLGDQFVNDDSAYYEPVQYMTATEGTKPATIAVIPEGFTKEELPLYEQLAQSGIEALFNTEPYKTYRNRFNVYFLRVPSQESGASVTDGNGTITRSVASYFKARWGQNQYGDMRADDDVVFDFVRHFCPDIVAGIHTIEETPILMIINDSRYGGICKSISNGKGYGMVPYTYNGRGLVWPYPSIEASTNDPLPTPITDEILQGNYRQTTQSDLNEIGGENRGDWRNTLIHEFGGHCFGRLGDEYWYDDQLNYTSYSVSSQRWPVPLGLNLASDPASAPWKADLLDRLDELTALDPHYGRKGTFQGGDYYLYGRWRSEKISCMIDNRPYFSAWQRYLIVKRIYTLSGDLDQFSFESWLAKDVTIDPNRDMTSSGIMGSLEHPTYTRVGPLPPPILEEE